MDVVYICRKGDNEELRYSIRSVVENLPHRSITVVGERPDWYVGPFIHVPARYSKVKNAKMNMRQICITNGISDEFILMNDDFFIMEKIDKLENYHQGTLLEKAKYYDSLSPTSIYTKYLWDTYDYLVNKGFQNPLNYEQHVPMVVTKNGLLNAIKPHGTLHRSIFGNRYLEGKSINMERDVKVYVTEPEKSFPYKTQPSPFLSTEDESFPVLLDEILKEKFPNKTKYER